MECQKRTKAPIRKVKQRNYRVPFLERWGYDNVRRIKVRPDSTITEWSQVGVKPDRVTATA